MDRSERFYRIDQFIRGRGSVSMQDLVNELEVSRATVSRDIQYMRDRLHAPIEWDANRRGYFYDAGSQIGPEFALPGLWFNAEEIHAILILDHFLSTIQPTGLLDIHVQPLRERLEQILGSGDHTVDEVRSAIKIARSVSRELSPEYFRVCATAVLKRQRLKITHFHRERNAQLEREVSPQRLVFYRGNWYMDAWCHMRLALRSFSVDAIEAADAVESPHKQISDEVLDEITRAGYGIYAGRKTQTAHLLFSPRAARWVEHEMWHADQKGETTANGGYLLKVPFSQDRELVMDILRHGAEVRVLAPESLRDSVRKSLAEAIAQY